MEIQCRLGNYPGKSLHLQIWRDTVRRSRHIIDLQGFYTKEPTSSVYGPLTPIPLDERPPGYQAPYDKLGLGGVDVDVDGDA